MWTKLKGVFTKEHYLSERTKRIIWAFILCVGFAGFFYPSVIGFFVWCAHPNTDYHGKKINLPMLWSEDTELSVESHWEKPPLHALTYFGDEVRIGVTPHRKSDQENVEIWNRIYGAAGSNDINQYPELRALTNLGMICGSIKYGRLGGQPDGVLAFGCLSRDHKTTFEYSGMPSGMNAGISIIQQLQ